jgi:hypothetical protein
VPADKVVATEGSDGPVLEERLEVKPNGALVGVVGALTELTDLDEAVLELKPFVRDELERGRAPRPS